jgi:phthiodiolone/phenolphthiodiolone dimycocerosates ketoreductase
MTRNVETATLMWGDRHMPASAVYETCRFYESHPAVDGVLFPDQLVNFFAKQLWTLENTPLAAIMADPDSHSDAFTLAAWAINAAPTLKLHLTTDAVRRAPSELVQSMLTLAHITEGRATFQIGGGETKQLTPFGFPDNQGMSRMKDLFEIYTRLWSSDQPIDYEGKRWKYEQAFLGGAKGHQPEVWALGSGPMLIDYATTYIDGVAIIVPMAWPTAEMAAENIAKIRKQVEEKGRDPEKFRIGLWMGSLIHEDQNYLDRAIANPIIKFFTGACGRIETGMWEQEGMPLPLKDGWTYYKDLLPHAMDDKLVYDLVGAVTDEHVLKSWFVGNPEETAAQSQAYIDAGADWVMPIDYAALVGGPEEGAAALARSAEYCAAVKANNSEPALARTAP